MRIFIIYRKPIHAMIISIHNNLVKILILVRSDIIYNYLLTQINSFQLELDL
jgi:hypothetical protein